MLAPPEGPDFGKQDFKEMKGKEFEMKKEKKIGKEKIGEMQEQYFLPQYRCNPYN